MNHGIVIRPFDRAADTEILSSIWFDASIIAHPFIGRRRLLEQRRLIADEYLPNAETWVASHSGHAIGFISLLDSFIGGLFVAPDRQGLGAGRRLVAHALAQKGALSLEVYTANEHAVRFYTSLGFSEVSRRDVDDFGYPYQNAALHLQG
ncbi:MAG: GNAT family N-acetyltransferase [Rhodobacteraceae bacterium]|nr:GNAT family N-acetyltransferase [Paracoccaceae bacterium]